MNFIGVDLHKKSIKGADADAKMEAKPIFRRARLPWGVRGICSTLLARDIRDVRWREMLVPGDTILNFSELGMVSPKSEAP